MPYYSLENILKGKELLKKLKQQTLINKGVNQHCTRGRDKIKNSYGRY